MSNKAFNKLNPFDAQLRQCFPVGMERGIQLVITKIVGFELFNTRPYHNYETWSDGYEVSDGKYCVKEEDLDDAMQKLMDLRTGKKESNYWDLLHDTSQFKALSFAEKD